MSEDHRSLFGDEESTDDSLTSLPTTGGVRITGATPAADDLLADWGLEEPEAEAALPEPELPHWTAEPTGQVPAVLARDEDGDEDPWASVPSPTWREESSDWDAHEESFDAGMLLGEEEPVGALNPEPVLEESQPWEFDLGEPEVPQGLAEDLEATSRPLVDDLLADIPDLPPVASGPPPRRRGGARSEAEERSEPARVAEPRHEVSNRGARSRRPEPDGGNGGRNLPVAVITGALIALLVLVTFNIGTVLAMILVTIVVTLAAAEAYAAFRRGGEHPATLLGLVAVIALLIGSYNKGTDALGLVTVLLVAFTVLWFMVGAEKAEFLKGASSTLLVFAWVGVFGSYAALLLNPNIFPSRHGLAFLLGAILVTVAYDVAALFVGSSVGKRPLAPSISPSKTWEGLIGATVAALLMAVIVVHLIHPWTLPSAFALGVVVSIVAPFGDLTESLIKRHLGLKDMGRLLPGHGGMLDRVDGLLFVLPATYYLVRAFNLA